VICEAETMMGLQIELEEAVKALTTANNSISLKSGCDLFLRYVTRTYLDIPVHTHTHTKQKHKPTEPQHSNIFLCLFTMKCIVFCLK
jgi:hypothetical protein